MPLYLPAPGDVAVHAVDGESALGVGVDVCLLAGLTHIHAEGDVFGDVEIALCGIQCIFTHIHNVAPEAARHHPSPWLSKRRFTKVDGVVTGHIGPFCDCSFHGDCEVCGVLCH